MTQIDTHPTVNFPFSLMMRGITAAQQSDCVSARHAAVVLDGRKKSFVWEANSVKKGVDDEMSCHAEIAAIRKQFSMRGHRYVQPKVAEEE